MHRAYLCGWPGDSSNYLLRSYDPRTGCLIKKYPVPGATQTTACAFGGPVPTSTHHAHNPLEYSLRSSQCCRMHNALRCRVKAVYHADPSHAAAADQTLSSCTSRPLPPD